MGHKLEFAPPRYTDVIAMNPEAFDWLPQGDPGVQEKWLGNFTERNLRLGFLRLDAGAVYQAGQFPSIEILFQIKGQVVTGGEQVRSRDWLRVPCQRRPGPGRGRRADRVPARGSTPVLSRRRVTGPRRSASHLSAGRNTDYAGPCYAGGSPVQPESRFRESLSV